MKILKKLFLSFTLVNIFTILFIKSAYAFTAPTDVNSFAYTMYDKFVTNGIGGPIGFSMGAALVGYGVYALAQQSYGTAIATLVSGGLLGATSTVVTSFGIVI